MTSLTHRACSIDDCGSPVRARELCNRHLLRLQRHGDPLGGGFSRPQLPSGPCSINGCDKVASSAGYCAMHYQRVRKHGDPSAVFWHNGVRQGESPNTQRDDLGRKLCTQCNAWLDVSLFKGNSHMADGLLSYCKRCYRDRAHCLDLDRRNLFLDQQNRNCAVTACDRTLALYGPNTYHIDHDHACCPGIHSCGGCIRGLICGGCNAALGYARDNPAILLALADYLVAHDEGKQILDV